MVLRSAVAAGDIILGALLPRIGEDVRGRAIFDQRAEVEKGGALRHARRLLHVMRHDHDGIAALELVDQFLDLGGGDRVEC